MRRLNLAACAAALAWMTACASEPAPVAPAAPAPAAAGGHTAITTEKLEPYECGTITRLHTYGGVFAASQPKPEDFAQAKQGGVRTVIDLRRPDEDRGFDEAKVVGDLGLRYVNLPWNGAGELTDQVFDRARELLNTAERPILMHCSSANRAGAVWIAWRALDGGLPVEDAVAEGQVVGVKSPEFVAKARDYVARRSKAR